MELKFEILKNTAGLAGGASQMDLSSMESLKKTVFSEAFLMKLVQIALILLIGWVIIRILLRVERRILIRSQIDDSAYRILLNVTRVLLWVLLLMTALGAAGISLAPLITVLGTCGVAVALALRDSLSNFAGGIILIFTKPFVKGDEIELNGVDGIVDYIDILTTRLHTWDNRTVVIPNGTITKSVLINCTQEDLRRVDLAFSVARGEDTGRVKACVEQVIRETPLAKEQPEPIVGIRSMDGKQVVFDVLVWARTQDRFTLAYSLREQVKDRFEREGIGTPMPVMEVFSAEAERKDRQ